jgi:hypothetical protein
MDPKYLHIVHTDEFSRTEQAMCEKNVYMDDGWRYHCIYKHKPEEHNFFSTLKTSTSYTYLYNLVCFHNKNNLPYFPVDNACIIYTSKVQNS